VDLEKRGDDCASVWAIFRRILALPQYLVGLQQAWLAWEAGPAHRFEDPPPERIASPRRATDLSHAVGSSLPCDTLPPPIFSILLIFA
jgi:hypothetical protein